MRVFSIIFGILMTIFGFVCMFTPLRTAFELSYFIVILVVAYGIIGFIDSIVGKSFGLGFVFSILSVLFGILLLVFPRFMVFNNTIIIYMAASWFVLEGIVSVIASLEIRKISDSKMWILQLIIGILGVLLGVYSFFHPILFGLSAAWMIGVLVGIYFVQSGISMLFLGAKTKED